MDSSLRLHSAQPPSWTRTILFDVATPALITFSFFLSANLLRPSSTKSFFPMKKKISRFNKLRLPPGTSARPVSCVRPARAATADAADGLRHFSITIRPSREEEEERRREDRGRESGEVVNNPGAHCGLLSQGGNASFFF